MSWWTRVRGALGFGPRAEIVRHRDDPMWYFQWLNLDSPTGIQITPANALDLSVVWACVSAITNAIAPSDWGVFTTTTQGRVKLDNDPMVYVLNTRANPDMTAIAFKEAMMFNALTWGNSYAEIQRTGSGKVAALWPLMPDRTIPRRDPATQELYYEHHQWSGGMVRLSPMQVYHLKGPGISGLMGDNIVARAAKAMGLAAAQERFASTYFGNNTNIGGLLKYPKTMDDKTYKRLKDDWEDKYKGPFKAHRPVILEGGMEWEPFEADASKAQLVESRMFQLEDICRWFGVPPHKVQHLLRATFNNIEHLGIEFVRDAVTPWKVRAQQEADYKFFPQRAPWRNTAIDTGWLMQGDAKSRADAYRVHRVMGTMTINEIREKEGQNHIGPAGDVRIVEKNMQTLEQLELGQTNPPSEPPKEDGEDGGDNEDKQPSQQDQGGAAAGGMAGREPEHLLKEAVQLQLTSILERHHTRITNRRADLARRGLPAPKVAQNLEDAMSSSVTQVLREATSVADLVGRVRPESSDTQAKLQLVAEAAHRLGDPSNEAADLVHAFFSEVPK